VRAALADALSVYAVDEVRLGALAPDLIVTQDLCEVCAVSLDDVRAAVARLAGRERVEILSLRPTCLEDVLGDVGRIAEALGVLDRGVELQRSLRDRFAAVAKRAEQASSRPGVVSLEWLDPLMIGGTWMPELIELAGGTPLGARPGAPAPTVTAEALRALDPDVIVIKPCGFTVARSLEERELLERSIMSAARSGARVYLTDGNAFFNRPGPRLVESAEILAACIHPELFPDFSHLHREAIVELGPSTPRVL
jgi:iron complex transport system substrate-binding protein